MTPLSPQYPAYQAWKREEFNTPLTPAFFLEGSLQSPIVDIRVTDAVYVKTNHWEKEAEFDLLQNNPPRQD